MMLQQHRSCFSFGGSFFLGARMKRYSSTMSKACRSSCKSVRLNSNKEHLPDTLICNAGQSSCKSASVIIVKPRAASVSWARSMLSTIKATTGRPCGRTSRG
jgi:hypothetical protein